MNLYKFTRSPGAYQIVMKENPEGDDISGYFNGDIIFSQIDEMEFGNSKYVLNTDDYIFYESYNPRTQKTNFTKSVVSEGTVADTTVRGLDVYDKYKGTVVSHASVGETLRLGLGFKTDENDNIWASVTYLDGETWKDGYVIYKNYRNNFVNIAISDFRYSTVLTEGAVDNKKVAELKEQPIEMPMMTFASVGGPMSAARVDALSTMLTTNQYNEKVTTGAPEVIQNEMSFPTPAGSKGGVTQYQFTEPGGLPIASEEITALYSINDLDVRSFRDNFTQNVKYYNRFKKAMPDDTLSRGFMHIFFTRPDCNVISGGALNASVASDAFFNLKYKQRPELVKQLVKANGDSSDFMMFLSNRASSFSLMDESIKYVEYGRNFRNYSVQLGKGIFDSQVAGTFEVKYTEDRDLDILALHKMWINYIANVYSGKWSPRLEYIWKKVLDYACSCYVVVTAEDAETILYWAKYYGVFPINVPYSSIAWDSGTVISKPDFGITYAYSWKDDWSPAILADLNINAFRKDMGKSEEYIASYNSNYGRAGTTWVGAPFVETIVDIDSKHRDYGTGVIQKLRFRPGPNKY